MGMRHRAVVFGILGMLALPGVNAPARAGASVQLFTDSGAPRFSFYLACISKTVNCEIIERMFGGWADDRQLSMHAVTPDQAAHFPQGTSQVPDSDELYRVTVRYAPEMAPTNNSLQGAGTGLPVVSYAATVRVFEASSGKLVKSMTWHNETMVNQEQGPANPYLDAQVHDFLKHLDPAYAKPPAP